jgi:hypothetical protein
VVRADAGFFDQQLLDFLELRGLSYIIVARLTRWLKREAARVTAWRALDQHYVVGSFPCNCWAGTARGALWSSASNCAPNTLRWEENCWRFPAIPSVFAPDFFPGQHQVGNE